MADNEYRGYLRKHMDMEHGGETRFQPTHSAHRPLIFGTLAVMGLLQVASSVTILLHLTGYLREVDLSSSPPIEEVHPEPVIADALRDFKKKDRVKKRDQMPVAHMSVKVPIDFASTDPLVVTTMHWGTDPGTLTKIKYHDGRLVMEEQGLYYVYAKTCFRYAPDHATKIQDVSNVQLIQYIYHEMHTQKIRPVRLSKSGGTLQWNNTSYNMYCVQQGRTVQLGHSDALFVNVSNSWLLDPDPLGTYFGAYKISN